MGLRLPLDALPWTEEREIDEPTDPFAPRDELHKRDDIKFGEEEIESIAKEDTTQKHTVTTEVTRTALCIEAREGRVHLFLPPMTTCLVTVICLSLS